MAAFQLCELCGCLLGHSTKSINSHYGHFHHEYCTLEEYYQMVHEVFVS